MAINLVALADTQRRRLLKAFNDAIQAVKDQATITDIERALGRGDVDAVLQVLGLDEAAFEPIENQLREAYRVGWLTGVEQIGDVPIANGNVALRFNMRNQRAEQWLAEESGGLIEEISSDQQDMVRERLTDNLARGVNPRQSALELVGIKGQSGKREGGYIGLTKNQAAWVSNARGELNTLNTAYFDRKLRDKRFDGIVRRAINNDERLTQKQINSIINGLQKNTLKYRGTVISRTESLSALRAGQYEAILQAIDKGELSLRDVTKKWDATGDKRTRLDHLAMETTYEEGIPVNQPFIAPDGSQLLYPGDSSLGASGAQTIQCRCSLVTEIDFLGRQARVEGFG